ncbi:hypothetical protein BC567DRAFT_27025 [Phyllosticta citribraziliensis]
MKQPPRQLTHTLGPFAAHHLGLRFSLPTKYPEGGKLRPRAIRLHDRHDARQPTIIHP